MENQGPRREELTQHPHDLVRHEKVVLRQTVRVYAVDPVLGLPLLDTFDVLGGVACVPPAGAHVDHSRLPGSMHGIHSALHGCGARVRDVSANECASIYLKRRIPEQERCDIFKGRASRGDVVRYFRPAELE